MEDFAAISVCERESESRERGAMSFYVEEENKYKYE